MAKGRLQLAILSALSDEPQPLYGMDIIKRLPASEGRYTQDAVGTTLSRLAKSGLLTSHWSNLIPTQIFRRLRYFQISDEGREALQQARDSHQVAAE